MGAKQAEPWTGESATRLQRAYRMTVDRFAGLLGVSPRTVANWSARPTVVPRGSIQELLDRALREAPQDVQERFSEQAGDRPHANAQALQVAISVVIHEGRVLLVRRRDGGDSLSWQFPAGVIKPGQRPEDVAERETYAETDIYCSVKQAIGSRVHPVTSVYCHYFLCDYLAGDASNRDQVENAGVTWAPVSDLGKFVPREKIYSSVLEILERTTVTDTRPPIAAAVIVHEGRVLMVQRRISEGSLSWQFPAGQVEEGETGEAAAVRETAEETGLTVRAVTRLGERVHPVTKRRMIYVACEVVAGEARVADADELADVAWCELSDLSTLVPHGFYGPVQEHLTASMIAA